MEDNRPLATIQVDVDGLWVIEKLLGKEIPIDPDPVFTLGLERLSALLWEFGVKATFFVVARDLESKVKVSALEKIVAQGHEIASHGLTHSYLTALGEDAVKREISESREKIERTLGVKIGGFKAAGFAAHKKMAGMLEESGYSYDSSVFGTSCAAVMQMASRVCYPKLGMMTASSKPYRPSKDDIFRKGDSGILEIPVTAAPFLRTPAHFSYMVLGGWAYAGLVRTLFRITAPDVINFLFHPLDLVDGYEMEINKKVCGLKVDSEHKLEMARDMLKFLCRKRNVVTTGVLSDILKGQQKGRV